MTATITPKSGMFELARTDPGLRRRDYELTLWHYLKALSQRAFDYSVFAENSDANLDSLRTLMRLTSVFSKLRLNRLAHLCLRADRQTRAASAKGSIEK
jgi:hypothetical protein